MNAGSGRKSRPAAGFTLAEISISLGVASIIGVILLYSLVQGVWLFRSNESEMWARDSGSSVIRTIRDDIQTSASQRIYPDYTQVAGVQTSNGSCAVIVLPDARGSVTYYRAPAAAGGTTGKIYYHSNGATAPNPATDKLLASNAMDFEFRRNPNGTVRVGFVLAALGYPRRLLGSVESDRVRFTTSAIPRNP